MTKAKINTLQFYLERLIKQYMWLVKIFTAWWRVCRRMYNQYFSSTGVPTSILFSWGINLVVHWGHRGRRKYFYNCTCTGYCIGYWRLKLLTISDLGLTQTKIRFRLDFLNALTVILPTLTRTLNILNRSNFCFPYKSFLYKFTLDNSNHASTWEVEKKCTAVQNINIILTTMLSSSVKFNTLFSTGYLSNIKVKCIHSPSHFVMFCYLLLTPDTSISLHGSSYRESTVCKYQNKTNSRGVIHSNINRDLSSGG